MFIGDIEIQFTGLRPGEKLYEELLIDAENVEKTDHERILRSFENYRSHTVILDVFNDLANINNKGVETKKLHILLAQYVSGFKPTKY